ncbi:YbaB/EbfC family nucleoid-associated protein [Crossiella sp. SN42]|uniref:YbaB/EbfC family nucleoid-associated protein n=1 Tax=Crossiella sp. SN42 TaxID=2944808 RepID=UPI00207C4B37|nr:YbaB/EbfC family nucleoid-associated protein [Crossiella sp. SN42]MCO1582067.1 YbaB/EbfC family nucleoid-associated protein [Crossiella sp. SN42]
MRDEQMRQLVDAVREVRDGMREITATADSPDGLITATVGARGEVLELELNPRIFRDPDSQRLAEDIVETIQRAVEEAQRQVFDLVRDFLPAGADPETADLDFDPFLHSVSQR